MGGHRSGWWVISPPVQNAAGGPHIHTQTLGVLPLSNTCRDSKCGHIDFGYEVRRDGGFELSHCIGALPEAAVPWPSPKGRQWWTRGVGGALVKNGTESTVHIIAKHLHLLENILVLWETRFRGGAATCGANHHPRPQELLSSKVALRGQRPQLSVEATRQEPFILPGRRAQCQDWAPGGQRGTCLSPSLSSVCPLDPGSVTQASKGHRGYLMRESTPLANMPAGPKSFFFEEIHYLIHLYPQVMIWTVLDFRVGSILVSLRAIPPKWTASWLLRPLGRMLPFILVPVITPFAAIMLR